MNSLSPSLFDRHARRLLVDEAEWRDRLNQRADMRRMLSAMPSAAGAAIVTSRDAIGGNVTGSS
jgi:hypothetical protein